MSKTPRTAPPVEPGSGTDPATPGVTAPLSPGADPDGVTQAPADPAMGETIPYIDPNQGGGTWDQIGGEHGIDGRAPADMADGADNGQTLGEQAGYAPLGEPRPIDEDGERGNESSDLHDAPAPRDLSSSEIVTLAREVIAGCRDMAADPRTPEDNRIQLNAWADRFEKHANPE